MSKQIEIKKIENKWKLLAEINRKVIRKEREILKGLSFRDLREWNEDLKVEILWAKQNLEGLELIEKNGK